MEKVHAKAPDQAQPAGTAVAAPATPAPLAPVPLPVPLVVRPMPAVGQVPEVADPEVGRDGDGVLARLAGVEPEDESGLVGAHVHRSAATAGGSAGGEPLVGREGGVLDGAASRAISSRIGAGRPLDSAVLQRMETAFETDLSQVRIHTDSSAASLNRMVSARAFTTGQDVFFGAGEYEPDTPAGERVLAHELAHTLQRSTSAHRLHEGADGAAPDTSGGVEREAGSAAGAKGAESHFTVSVDGTERELSREDALATLGMLCRRVESGIAADRENLRSVLQAHIDQPVAAGMSDYFGGGGVFGSLHWPDPRSWDGAAGLLERAQATVKSGDVVATAPLIQQASDEYRAAHAKLAAYRKGSDAGAEHAVSGLRVVEAAGAIAATVATGGVASGAGLGLLGTSAAIGGTAGLYGASQTEAEQTGEMIAGTRGWGEFDPAAILERGGTDAVVGFVGAFAGGALTNAAIGAFGKAAMAAMSAEQLAAVARAANVEVSALRPEVFVGPLRRFVVELFSGAATAPLTTGVQVTLSKLAGHDFPKSPDDFAEMVVKNAVQGGLVQVFVGGLTHGSAAAGLKTGFEPTGTPGPEPVGATPDVVIRGDFSDAAMSVRQPGDTSAAAAGDIGAHRQQGGRGTTLISEHVVPGAQVRDATVDPTTGAPDWQRSNANGGDGSDYNNATTIVENKAVSDRKTALDNAATTQLQQRGGPTDLVEDLLLPSLDRHQQATDAAIAAGEITPAQATDPTHRALAAQAELWGAGERSGGGASARAGGDNRQPRSPARQQEVWQERRQDRLNQDPDGVAGYDEYDWDRTFSGETPINPAPTTAATTGPGTGIPAGSAAAAPVRKRQRRPTR